LDEIFDELFANKRKLFQIQNLNREISDSEIQYFDLTFIATGITEYPLICLIKDVSDFARQKQTIVQQKNEIALLENMLARRNEFLSASILGESEPVDAVRTFIDKLSRVPTASILLLGESGTGKNLVANIIHYSSKTSKSPFVEINCAAIPETLLESELFGYEKGAFTNAVNARKGLIEDADEGTLFLDEIGELPLNTQAKLLSFLESRKFRRLGSNVEREVNLRLIAATNRNLDEMVSDGQFREDLLFRLNVVTIKLPPLRELANDVLIIASHFVQIFNSEFNKNVKGLTTDAQNLLLNYGWPGNVRELSNCIERAMIFIESDLIDANDLVLGSQKTTPSPGSWTIPHQGIDLEDVEQQLIKSALSLSNGNKSHAARLLGLTRDTLRYRLEKYNLE